MPSKTPATTKRTSATPAGAQAAASARTGRAAAAKAAQASARAGGPAATKAAQASARAGGPAATSARAKSSRAKQTDAQATGSQARANSEAKAAQKASPKAKAASPATSQAASQKAQAGTQAAGSQAQATDTQAAGSQALAAVPFQPKYLAFLGIACTLAWAFLINGFVGGDSEHQAPWNIAYGALALCTIAFGLIASKTPEFLTGRTASICAACVGAVASCAMVVSYNVEALAILQLPLTILCTAVLGWLYMQWGLFYTEITTKFAVGCLFAANIAGSVLKTIAHFSPLAVCCILGCLLPVGSVVLANMALREDAPHDKPAIHFTKQNVRGLWKVALTIIAFSFVTAFLIRRFAINQSYIPAPDFLLARLFEIVVSGIVLYAVFKRDFAFNFPQLWRMVLVVLAVDLFFQAVAPHLSIVRCVESSAWDLIVLCAWFTLADIARHSDMPVPLVFGLGWACYAASFALGSAAATVFPFGSFDAATNASIMLILLLTSTFALELRDQDTKWIFAELSGEPISTPAKFESIDDRCKVVAAEHGLTPRETEIMQMLCKGRTKAYIAETLYLAENTVRGHTKHIYTKLDIHSKQELLDLIEQ